VERRRLGRTGFEISVIGFGAWEIGGPGGTFAWKRQDDSISIRAIHAALDAGVNWIDTAPAYGLGHSERVVGRALRSTTARPLLFTKCSLVWDDDGELWSDLTSASIRKEVAASLHRLGVDVIDLYQIHWPAPERQIERAWETLADLRQEGLVRAIGVSNFDMRQMQRLLAITPIGSLQSPYSLLHQEVEREIFPYCAAESIGVLAYSPLASGLLGGTITRERMAALPADDWRHRDPMFQEPYLTQHLEVVDLLRELADAHDATPASVAIAWVLRNPAVTGAIVGISRADQIPAAVRSVSLASSGSELAAIEARAHAALKLPRPMSRFEPRERPGSASRSP
jgi:aryl-alcohol dehydrogenase-like predicted oxidoreductase